MAMMTTPRRTFQLTARRDYRAAEAKPSIQSTLDRYLAKSRWDDHVIGMMERAIDRWHRSDDGTDAEYRVIKSAESAIKEWRRIQQAKPLPTTAWLTRQTRIGSREERAVAIYKRIRAATDDRATRGEARMRQFKTYKAQQNERRRVLGADPILTRLTRYEALLARYVPDVRTLARQASWRTCEQRRAGIYN